MGKHIFVITLFLCCLLVNISYTQESILQFDPSLVAFHATDPPNFYESKSPIRVSVLTQTEWNISCIVELLSSGNNIISNDRIFLKKEGEESYRPITTAIHIGSGPPTSIRDFQEITTLQFAVHILMTDPAGTYLGAIKFFNTGDQEQNAIAVLPLTLLIEPRVNFELHGPNVINLNITGEPGVYSSDDIITLSGIGNIQNWHIIANYLGCQNGDNFTGNNFFIKSSQLECLTEEDAGIGYKRLGHKRRLTKRMPVGTSIISELEFKVLTLWNIQPGTYNCQIEIYSSYNSVPQIVNLVINISEYLAINLSDTEVNINSNGPPGEYEGDREITLKVASNTEKWEAHALGENLKSSNDEIPAERVFILSSDKINNGFMALNQERVVASGTFTGLNEVCQMRIMVATELHDRPGSYSGKIYFTVIAIP